MLKWSELALSCFVCRLLRDGNLFHPQLFRVALLLSPLAAEELDAVAADCPSDGRSPLWRPGGLQKTEDTLLSPFILSIGYDD